MRFNVKSLVILILLIASLSAVFYTLQKPRPKHLSDAIQVLEASRSLSFLPQYLAQEKGFFEEQKLHIELKTAAAPSAVTTAIKNQDIAFILCGIETAVNSTVQAYYSPVALAAFTNREGSFLLGRKDQTGFTWKDVKGNSIIVDGPDSIQSMLLEYVLREKELGPNYDVNIIQNLPNHLKSGVFKSGTASFIALDEPEATILENSGSGRVVLSLGMEGGTIPAAVLISSRQFLKAQPETAQRYTNAIYKAQLWIKYHKTPETAALIKDYFPQINEKVLAAAIDRYKAQETWSYMPVISRTGFEHLIKIMKRSGELIGEPKYEEKIDNKFAEKSVQTITYTPEQKKQKSFPFSLWQK